MNKIRIENIELVIFDCDGVLVDSEGIANRLFAAEVRALGFDLSDDEAMHHFPGTRLADCIKYVETKSGRSLPTDMAANYRVKSGQAFAERLQPIPGIAHVLNKLKYNKVVASNGPRKSIVENLGYCHLLHHFDEARIFSAYDIQKWKPEPDLFLEAGNKMKIDPRNCLVIEDSIHGVEAAIRAGMQVIGFTHGGKNSNLAAQANYTIHEMEELLSLFQN